MKAKIPNALLSVAYRFSLSKSRPQLYRGCTEFALFSDENYLSARPSGERLPWAQEVRGSNPRAPTNSPNRIIELACYPFPSLLHCGASWEQQEKCPKLTDVETWPKPMQALSAGTGRLRTK